MSLDSCNEDVSEHRGPTILAIFESAAVQIIILSVHNVTVGSAVAFGKLHGIMASKPMNLPGKNAINIGLALGNVAAATAFLTTGDASTGTAMLLATTAMGGAMGAHMTASIGGVKPRLWMHAQLK